MYNRSSQLSNLTISRLDRSLGGPQQHPASYNTLEENGESSEMSRTVLIEITPICLESALTNSLERGCLLIVIYGHDEFFERSGVYNFTVVGYDDVVFTILPARGPVTALSATIPCPCSRYMWVENCRTYPAFAFSSELLNCSGAMTPHLVCSLWAI